MNYLSARLFVYNMGGKKSASLLADWSVFVDLRSRENHLAELAEKFKYTGGITVW
jgi:hypothetical protein